MISSKLYKENTPTFVKASRGESVALDRVIVVKVTRVLVSLKMCLRVKGEIPKCQSEAAWISVSVLTRV